MPDPISAITAGSAVLGASSANKAAKAQSKAADQQVALQKETRDLIRGDLSSYREGGNLAQQAYLYELGLGPAPVIGGTAPTITEIPGTTTGGTNALAWGGWGNMQDFSQRGSLIDAGMSPGARTATTTTGTRFQVGDQIFNTREEAEAYANANPTGGTTYGGYTKTPGYDFRLGEGLNALEASAAARGGLYSGAAMRDALQYGQDYATSEYQNYLARLGGMVDTGLNAASMSGQASQNAAAGISNALGNKADAQSAGYIGVSNALNSGIGNLIGYQQYQNLLQRLPVTGTP